jgi:hypothetical protein
MTRQASPPLLQGSRYCFGLAARDKVIAQVLASLIRDQFAVRPNRPERSR